MTSEKKETEFQQSTRYLARSLENESHWHVWDDKHFVTFTGEDDQAVTWAAMWALEHLDELMQKAPQAEQAKLPNQKDNQESADSAQSSPKHNRGE